MKKIEESNVLLNVSCLENVLKDTELLNEMLVGAGYLISMDIAIGEKEYFSFLKDRNYGIIILADYTLPGFSVPAALKLALALQPKVPLICVSSTIGEDKDVELFKQGATDYVLKDRLGRFAFEVRRTLEGVEKQKKWEKAEQALQSENNFQRSISESPLGISIVSLDGKTIYANKAFLDIHEFNSLEEFISISAINRYTPESYVQHQERKEKRKNGQDVFDYEISIVCGNAKIRYVKVSRKEILWNGIKHYQVINLDITEQKKLTIDLLAAQEHAKESDRLKSAFLANISHEIRTPMNGILGFADLLKEPNLTGKEQQEYIRIIKKSGVRMLNIINDIVDISKIESGLMEITISETNVNEQIKFIYTFFKPEVESKGMQIFFQNSLPVKEAIIKSDREKIYAILTNLVRNAIKYSDKGTIEFGYKLKVNNELDELEFFVKDTGIGILKDRQKAVFERFVQVDIGNERTFQGAGLGLSISKAYVEMLGGKIWVESELEKGSTFYFTIPYNGEAKEKNAVKNVVLPEGAENLTKKLKILIAEDDESSAMLLTKIVIKYCKKIMRASTGDEAIEVCRSNPDIDLVLMGIQMPWMNGYEATRQIRQFNKEVIIIAQTADVLGVREKATAAGCNDYISKPISQALWIKLMKKHLNKQESEC